jgi:hypothetical protein
MTLTMTLTLTLTMTLTLTLDRPNIFECFFVCSCYLILTFAAVFLFINTSYPRLFH